MKLFAIHAPLTMEAGVGPEGARAAKTGFSLLALLFGPLWLLARGLWLALLAYALLAAVVIGLVRAGLLSGEAAAGLAVLGQLYLAVAGRALALAARERAGRPLVDLVHAHSALEAEKIYLDRVLRPVPPAPRRGAPPAPVDVIGLFPEPGR
jgi:hypothetical protein